MARTFLDLDGGRIHFHESEGTGPSILLIHGNSSSSLTFDSLLDSSLGDSYRMIAIDLPGHGDSPPPSDPVRTYSLPGYAEIVADLVRSLHLRNPILVGWSLGGHIALEVASTVNSLGGILIFGAPPLGHPPAMAEAFLPHESSSVLFDPETNEELIRQLANDYFVGDPAGEIEKAITSWLATDGQARAFLGRSFASGMYADEVEVAARLAVPLAVLHGEGERFVNLGYFDGLELPTLWRGAVQVVPEAGHAIHLEKPAIFTSLLEDFVSDVQMR